MAEPMNQLEAAFARALRGPEGRPEFFRQLRESNLFFLMPYHPEMDGIMKVAQGDQFNFTVWENSETGRSIPLFTSLERVDEALKNIGAPEDQYTVAEMKGLWLFDVLAKQPDQFVLNPACSTGCVYLDTNAARMLADGTILRPVETKGMQRRSKIVDPADYPTDLLQPAFRFLRQQPDVLAAWLFEDADPPNPALKYYCVALLIQGQNARQIEQDLAVVIRESQPENWHFAMSLLDPKSPGTAQILAQYVPFYAAPHFHPPRPMP